jgi:phage terminase large subunit-like protein
MALSLAQIVAELSPDEREAALAGLDEEALLWDWGFWGRPEQRKPLDDDTWSVCAYLGGRGVGKTRTASEWVREKAKRMPGSRGAFVARTSADVRDVMIQGESGIMAVSPPSERPLWEPSKRLLTWPNGSTAIAFSSDEPNQLRGPQFHWASCDEWAAWKWIPDDSGLTAWENVRIATRLGAHPQIFAMTTPKRIPAIKALLAEAEQHPERVLFIRGTTMDNVGNLSAAYLDVIMGLYEGTSLARQELYGEMLDKVEGALWQEDLIDEMRVRELPSGLTVVVGVDPSVSENPRDECGIVVVGATRERKLYRRSGYVIEDASVHGSPGTWARRVVAMANKYQAPVVAEVNQGGALVRGAINGIDPSIRVIDVRAHVGKVLRAEPVVLAYEQRRIHHLNVMPELESQMLSWEPGASKKSPDRIDALVHALSALVVKQPAGFSAGGARAKSAASGSIPKPMRRR